MEIPHHDRKTQMCVLLLLNGSVGSVSECMYSLTPWRFLTFLHFQCVTTKSWTDTLEDAVCVCIFRSKFLSVSLALSLMYMHKYTIIFKDFSFSPHVKLSVCVWQLFWVKPLRQPHMALISMLWLKLSSPHTLTTHNPLPSSWAASLWRQQWF